MKQATHRHCQTFLTQHKGQISIEYLLVLAAFFSILGMLLPQITAMYASSVLAIETKNAEQFAETLTNTIQKINIYENNSQTILELNPKLEWIIEVSNKIAITISSESGQENTVEKEIGISNVNYFELHADKKTKIKIFKQDNYIYLEEI